MAKFGDRKSGKIRDLTFGPSAMAARQNAVKNFRSRQPTDDADEGMGVVGNVRTQGDAPETGYWQGFMKGRK